MTARALLLGLTLIPLSAWWLAQIEYVRYSDLPTVPAVFFHCVATLLLLTGLNALVRRRAPALALRPEELATVYALQVIGSNLAGHDQLQILFTTIAWPRLRATPENRWGELLLPNLPGLLMPEGWALPPLFAGHSSLYVNGHWRAWLVPLAIWICFVFVVAGTMFCLVSLLCRQWDHERLSYPLTEVPLGVISPERGMFRRPVFWIAYSIAAGLQLLALASVFAPTLPAPYLGVRYYELPAWPWRAAGGIPVCYFPFAVGLTFLLPLQLAFSCWFFFLVSRLELVAAAAMGYMSRDDFPYIDQQSTGAYLAFAATVIWAARGHLTRAWQAAFSGRGEHDSSEPLSYRAALIGFGLGMALLLAFLLGLGMRPWVASAYLGLLFLFVLAITRLRAEVGLPTVELFQRGADDTLVRTLGAGSFSGRELGAMSLLFFLNRTHRQFPMTHQADALRLADRVRLDQRGFALALLAATGLGAAAAFWALLHVTYQTGLASGHFAGTAKSSFGDGPWLRMANWIASPPTPRASANWAYLFGASFTLLLVHLRARFLWWPIHPAGYVVASSVGLQRLWLPLLVSWLAKSLILRYGGLRGYRNALPFFMGLVLGEFSAGLLRTVLDLAFGLYLPARSGIGGL